MIITLSASPQIGIIGNFQHINILCSPNIKITPIIGGIGTPGLQGPQGIAGTNFNSYIAGENLSGHTAVYIESDGKAYTASPLNYKPITGVTVGSASIGTNVDVQHTGVISMNGWNFALNSPIFVLMNGTLSTTEDTSAQYSTIVGISNSPTSLVVGIQPQIKLN